uniref:Retrovirus-related Pol polyprotein from transposon TNT 1-94 n=1 Tax=Tanacetum cinerariifolium TaxID=118510 RepID=A0A6L2MSI5_TANCI|nr:retrovirus-related Pol polyprotein from transposon TNT 1-94 [Tanacetum cinerariifolium]
MTFNESPPPTKLSPLVDDDAEIMHHEFEISMMGELNFFLGLKIKQMKDRIFFNQSKYIKEMLMKFGLEDSKPTKTPMSTKIKITKGDEADSVVNTKYQVLRCYVILLSEPQCELEHPSHTVETPTSSCNIVFFLTLASRQGMSSEEMKQVVAQRVTNAIEAIVIYVLKIRMAHDSMNQVMREEATLGKNVSNKRK